MKNNVCKCVNAGIRFYFFSVLIPYGQVTIFIIKCLEIHHNTLKIKKKKISAAKYFKLIIHGKYG